jgi:beta-glucosidase-like glycosyl hydrolase
LSPEVIGIIREQGFDGIIMTDSLAMMAIVQNYGEKECLGLAIKAGCDMVLPNYRLSYKDSFDYLMKAYNEGVITEERLNDAVRHVLEAQKKASKPATVSEVPDELKDTVIYQTNANSAERKMEVTVVSEELISYDVIEEYKKAY